MKWKLVLTGMMLLTACAGTGGSSVDAVCSIPPPKLEEEGLSDHNILELDLFAERYTRACL